MVPLLARLGSPPHGGRGGPSKGGTLVDSSGSPVDYQMTPIVYLLWGRKAKRRKSLQRWHARGLKQAACRWTKSLQWWILEGPRNCPGSTVQVESAATLPSRRRHEHGWAR